MRHFSCSFANKPENPVGHTHPNIMRYYISWAHYKFKSSSRNATYWVLEKSKIKTLKFIMKHQNQGIFTATHFQKSFYVPWLKDVSKYFPIF